VFTLGPGPADAIKAGGDVRGRRRAPCISRGCSAIPIPLAREDIDALYDRYQNVYGQR
jgi:L-ribulose-5-phosphate 4-epimerase